MEPAPVRPVPARTLSDGAMLTFLFTDVEGSTPLWEQHEATMRAVTARHDALLDTIITGHGGTRVRERGEGDSLFAVFAEPAAAVAAALTVARAVLAEPWPPETPIRVRMGLHTGGAQVRAGDYYGPVVNRCARIRGLGHGGQVLLSTATAALVRDALPSRASLRPLGAHPLKGLTAAEEVYQLCHPDLPADFPPLLSPGAARHNLPLALTALIGREAEQGEVLALLAEARLVTLTGSGGVGKTRLALAVAAELVDQYPDGVWLVELATLAEDRLVPQTVLETLGTREEPGRPLLTTLADHLQDRQLLLVLDNCEHLVAACAALAAVVLRRCPGVRVLATSREGLDVAGEHRYRVPSLPVPDLAHLPPLERLAEEAAVALFVARARERRPDFALTALNARNVAAVCARLDGIPLAIELAAARVGSLDVEGIAARLDDRFRLLTGGPRSALPRQRTLRAALDWSYDLLGEAEQALLDRLSVFAGGWTLAVAEAVCAGDGVEQERLGGSHDLPCVGKWEILDLLGSLVNKSLVHAEEAGGEVRYGLLETVRQYGQERLAALGAAEAVRDRHLAWYLALAEEAAPHLAGAAQVTWLDRLEAEHDNLRAALRWARERPRQPRAAQAGLRLAGALWRFWFTRGYFHEGRVWLEAALAADDQKLPAVRAGVLRGAGLLAWQQCQYVQAVTFLEEGLALRRQLGDTRGIAGSLNSLGLVAYDQGDYARAVTLLEEGLVLDRQLGDRRGVATSLGNLGWAVEAQGDYGRAMALQEESLALRRELGDSWGIATSLGNMGIVAFHQGDHERAKALQEESLALRRTLGDSPGIAYAIACLGWLAYRQGDHGRTAALLEESLRLSRDIGVQGLLVAVLDGLAWVAVARGQPWRAARIGGAVEALLATLGIPLRAGMRTDHERAVLAMRAALGEESFAAAWAEGRVLALDEAIALALESERAAA